ncbi:MAG: hypothetical protein AAGA54_29250 [Myxococcota bacterium]
MGRWGLLFGGCVLLGACQQAETFTCADDGQCVAGEAVGQCELNGHCSFFDPDCPSQRRYGQVGPTDLAGTCVPPPDDVPDLSTSGQGSSTTSEPTTTSLTTSSSTTGDPSPSTTSMVSMTSDGSSGDPVTTTDESTESTGAVDGCPTFVDDFEDGVIDPFWDLFMGDAVSEADGELVISLEPPANGYVGIGTFAGFDLSNGHVTAEMGQTSEFLGHQSVFLLQTPSNDIYTMIIQESLLEIRARPDGGRDEYLATLRHDAVAHRYLRMSGDGSQIRFQASADGETFEVLASADEDETQMRVDITGTDWASDGTTGTLTFRHFSYCDLNR